MLPNILALLIGSFFLISEIGYLGLISFGYPTTNRELTLLFSLNCTNLLRFRMGAKLFQQLERDDNIQF